MKNYLKVFHLVLISILALSACSMAEPVNTSESVLSVDDITQTRGVTSGNMESSREDNGDPDYGIVFPQDKVNEITITISPDNWELMMNDMTELYGEQGSGQGPAPAGNRRQLPENGQKLPPPAGIGQNGPPLTDQRPGLAMKGGSDDQNPVWVEAEITFSDQTWEHVGIRFKGNSSLKSTWGRGSIKLPFKLDFDEYEDTYPETEDQRFYGFKQLSFGSNFHDDSLLREKVAADLFRDAGVPAAQTAFYAVSIDYGDGPVYIGLYTAVEVIDDTVIETQFSNDDGNVYKPEGAGASFAEGSFSEASFDKETNQEEDDYSDILALFDALHDETRITDPKSWRQGLEEVFDVDTFLNWLAVNTVIQNWDVYGAIGHNYYLYNDPDSGQLVWIPWDHNESLKSREGIRPALSFSMAEVSAEWPLISFLRDDPVYYEKYLGYLESFLEEGLVLEDLAAEFEAYHQLIEPYVLEEDPDSTLISSLAAFEHSVSELLGHVKTRINAGESFLNP